jgi:ABC-type arginine/histidine transport system permease subunit
VFTVATVLYMMVTLIVVTIMRFVEGKIRIPGTIAMGKD